MTDNKQPQTPNYVGMVDGIRLVAPTRRPEHWEFAYPPEDVRAAIKADRAMRAAERANRVYLVNTGEIRNGHELYERHDAPVPLADFEVLYTAQPETAAVAGPSDEELLALNAGEVYFSESPSKYPEAGHGTQYHAGAPGVIEFARAVLVKWGAAPTTQAPQLKPDFLPFSVRQRIADQHGVKLTAGFNALVRDVIKAYLDTHGVPPPQPAVSQAVGWVDDGGQVFWKGSVPTDGSDLFVGAPAEPAVSQGDALRKALDFIQFCWRELPLNEYAEERRAEVEQVLSAALAQPQEAAPKVPALPPSYVGSSLIGKPNGECAINFHFSNTEEADKWFESVTEPKEAAPSQDAEDAERFRSFIQAAIDDDDVFESTMDQDDRFGEIKTLDDARRMVDAAISASRAARAQEGK